MVIKVKEPTIQEIQKQMMESRPLPMTPEEFEEWSDRQIAGACIVKSDDPERLKVSQKFALASMIMHLAPTESHKPDAYFIHSLRKAAANQVAHAVMVKFKEEQKAKEDAEKKAQEEAARDILEKSGVQSASEDVVQTS